MARRWSIIYVEFSEKTSCYIADARDEIVKLKLFVNFVYISLSWPILVCAA